jgi:hypothetical protein
MKDRCSAPGAGTRNVDDSSFTVVDGNVRAAESLDRSCFLFTLTGKAITARFSSVVHAYANPTGSNAPDK